MCEKQNVFPLTDCSLELELHYWLVLADGAMTDSEVQQ